jgi:hypothetical protein
MICPPLIRTEKYLKFEIKTKPMENVEPILVFVNKLSPRKLFTFRFVFDILQVPYRFTTKLEEFVAYNGPKFSYTQSRLAGEFHIHASGLLDEKGIKPKMVEVDLWDGLPVIFGSVRDASMPFDLFSGIFYLVSRYEEYLSEQTDEHGRFSYEESLAYRHGFLDKPLVDLWIERFKQVFTHYNPGYEFPQVRFRFRPLLSVSISHLFKHKGIVRIAGGILDNFFRFQFKNLYDRLLYLFTDKRDPFDTFYKIIALKKQYNVSLVTFFLIGDYSGFDHNVSINRPAFRKLIKTMSDYSNIGLMISYHHAFDENDILKDRKALEDLIHKPVDKSHFHYYRQRMPHSYRMLSKLEFKEDFSCGYPKQPGYRASTAYPFPFYDLEEEEPTGLIIHPVVVTDYHLNFILEYSPEQALAYLTETGRQIRRTGGYFQPLFHNSVLSEFEVWRHWSNVYIKLLEQYAE